MGIKTLSILLVLGGCLGYRVKTEPAPIAETNLPRNVILLIGDGMGLSQVSILHQEQDNLSAFSRFKNIGLINVSSKSHKITDSAAGATAFASGVKTYNGAIGVDKDTMAVPTILEWFAGKGYATGLVATSSITHATPACFYAHTNDRDNEYEIAKQLLQSRVDFFAGGGRTFLSPLIRSGAAKGWVMDTSDFLQFPLEMEGGQRYGFILAAEGMPRKTVNRGSFCTDASRLAIGHLGKNKQGFFLMIEGSQIDWAGHANDYPNVKAEMEDFNEVVNMVMDFAEKDGNTLVIVLADHETGGLALVPGTRTENGKTRSDYDVVEGKFNTGGHSATLIPVFAYGPGSEDFRGVYQNTDIFYKIKARVEGQK